MEFWSKWTTHVSTYSYSWGPFVLWKPAHRRSAIHTRVAKRKRRFLFTLQKTRPLQLGIRRKKAPKRELNPSTNCDAYVRSFLPCQSGSFSTETFVIITIALIGVRGGNWISGPLGLGKKKKMDRREILGPGTQDSYFIVEIIFTHFWRCIYQPTRTLRVSCERMKVEKRSEKRKTPTTHDFAELDVISSNLVTSPASYANDQMVSILIN